MTITIDTRRNCGGTEIHQGTLRIGNHMAFLESLCSKLLLHQEEGWQVTASTRLSTGEQMDKKKSEHITSYPFGDRLIGWMHPFYEV
jgi:hypothetical protein